ncbi:hypothetical protein Vi05172_g2370 [Venturia inaequalis]|nr:hypothetical protein Vi05172_g2370 [Venturia inaequalis]
MEWESGALEMGKHWQVYSICLSLGLATQSGNQSKQPFSDRLVQWFYGLLVVEYPECEKPLNWPAKSTVIFNDQPTKTLKARSDNGSRWLSPSELNPDSHLAEPLSFCEAGSMSSKTVLSMYDEKQKNRAWHDSLPFSKWLLSD